MTAAVLYGREDVRVESVPLPIPGSGEIRIRIESALTCGTDVKVYRRGSHARMIRPPAVFGHEFAGIVDRSGPGADSALIGRRVVAANSAPCGNCYFCSISRWELCEDLLFLNGAYAEYIVVPERIVKCNLHVIPDALPFQNAALAEPLACVVRGMQALKISEGQSIAVLGLGPIGLMFVRMCVLRRARVIAVGRRVERLAIAARLGADAVIDIDSIASEDAEDAVEAVRSVTENGRGPDVVIEAVGSTNAWETAIAMARNAGTVCLFGGCPAGSRVSLDTHRVHYDELTLLGTFHHTPAAFREAIGLISDNSIMPELFITERASLGSLPEVLAALAAGTSHAVKVAISP